jgi:hypothetical protein
LYFSGEVVITLHDGRELRHREPINRGAAERPILRDDIVVKFMDNAQMALQRARAQGILERVLAADRASARVLESALSGKIV